MLAVGGWLCCTVGSTYFLGCLLVGCSDFNILGFYGLYNLGFLMSARQESTAALAAILE